MEGRVCPTSVYVLKAGVNISHGKVLSTDCKKDHSNRNKESWKD